ncbi:Elongation of very long chain fatty acids protein 7 [Schistosoma japonicum]|nr:Elongation of very long chain fatty acids protein 7 [Schistosoma japonicum]
MIILDWLSKNLLPSKPDPRLDAYPLMESWTPTAIISLIYVIGVYAWKAEHIKRYKKQNKNKEEYNIEMKNNKFSSRNLIKQLMILYNVIMVIYSSIITLGILWGVYTLGYGLGCEELPDPNDTKYDTLVWTGYLFYFSKFVEMLDTVFFLLRGKVDQVTFLHVFHHATMPPSIWWGVKYAPGGIVFMFPLVNSFIHVIMYTYYGLAAAEAYRYLWWKNYLTLAQMIQFIILILHQGQIFLLNTPCNYPKVFPAAIVLYASLFLILFSNFYIKAYWHKQRLAKSLAQQQQQQQQKITTTNNNRMVISMVYYKGMSIGQFNKSMVMHYVK